MWTVTPVEGGEKGHLGRRYINDFIWGVFHYFAVVCHIICVALQCCVYKF